MAKFGAMAMGAEGPLGIVAAGSLAIGAAMGTATVASITMAAQFDQAMHKIAALTDTSTAQVKDYEQQILQMGPALDMSSTQMAQALYFVISAGFQGSAAMTVLKYSAEAATAGMTDQAGVADA